MSGFPEILAMVTVFFFLTLLPGSAILAAVLSKQIAARSLQHRELRGRSNATPELVDHRGVGNSEVNPIG